MFKFKQKYFASIFFSLLFLLAFILPHFSLAQVAPTGLPCNPDIVPAYIYPNQIAPATCTTSPQVAGDILHLKWDLQGTYQYPDCHITCNNDLPGLTMYPCRSFNPNVSGSFVNDIRLANYTYNISNRDSNNFLSATGTQQDLKAKDDVYVRNAQAGDDYLVTCREKDKVDAEAKVKTSVLARVVEGKGIGGGEPCEVGFTQIMNKLDAFQPFTITEIDFRDWSKTQDIDLDAKGGSGDNSDLKKAFLGESCTTFDLQYIFDFVIKFEGTATKYFEKYEKTNDAAMFSNTVFKKTPQGLFFVGWHELIFIGFDRSKTSNISEDTGYYLKYLDPNDPSLISTTFCKKREVHEPYGVTKKLFVCDYKYNDTDSYLAPFVIHDDEEFTANVEENRIRTNTAVWLSNPTNVPLIYNFSIDGVTQGVCNGWSKTVLGVAYLGDFVGTDYHPNDGKTVGKDCDANHYPLPTKTSLTTPARPWALLRSGGGGGGWLANVWSAWYNVFK